MWWNIGVLAMVAFNAASSLLRATFVGTDFSYAIGDMIDGLYWPATITCLLIISAYFRRAPRRLAVAGMIVFGIHGIWQLARPVSEKETDRAAEVALAEEAREVKRQALQVSTVEEQAAVTQRTEAIFQNAAGKMASKQSAGEMRALAKFMQPLIDQRHAFDAASREFYAADGDWVVKYLDSKESLALGRERLARLRQSRNDLAQVGDSLFAKASTMAKNNDNSLGIGMEVLKGLSMSYQRNAQNLKDSQEARSQMFARMDDALAMLQTEWGQWSIQSDGMILWKSTSLMEKFKAIISEIAVLVARLDELEKAMRR